MSYIPSPELPINVITCDKAKGYGPPYIHSLLVVLSARACFGELICRQTWNNNNNNNTGATGFPKTLAFSQQFLKLKNL